MRFHVAEGYFETYNGYHKQKIGPILLILPSLFLQLGFDVTVTFIQVWMALCRSQLRHKQCQGKQMNLMVNNMLLVECANNNYAVTSFFFD